MGNRKTVGTGHWKFYQGKITIETLSPDDGMNPFGDQVKFVDFLSAVTVIQIRQYFTG